MFLLVISCSGVPGGQNGAALPPGAIPFYRPKERGDARFLTLEPERIVAQRGDASISQPSWMAT